MNSCDAVVIGGGPAGAVAASIIARRGNSVVLFERESQPAYKIGESLLPSIHGVANLIGLGDELDRAGFVIKRGGTLKWGPRRSDPWNFLFASSPLLQGPTSYSYQVERRKFDQILLENASRVGADVRLGCRVTELLHGREGRVVGVSYTDERGTLKTLRTRFVVDGSGHTSRLYAAAGGTRIPIPELKNVAVFTYFEGGGRLPAPYNGNVVSEALDGCWMWHIPLSESLTSVGLVLLPPTQATLRDLGPERTYDLMLAQSRVIGPLLAGTPRVRGGGDYGKVRVRRDFSYTTDRFWFDGLALIGDAACFVDPVFSTGVHLATYSGILVGRSINTALANEDDERAAFAEFEYRYRREFSYVYQFLRAWYDLNNDWKDVFRVARGMIGGAETDEDAFLRLVAGLGSPEPASAWDIGIAVNSMALALEAVAASETDAWPDELVLNAGFREVLRESSQLQRMAASSVGERRPLAPAGAKLLATADGLAWQLESALEAGPTGAGRANRIG